MVSQCWTATPIHPDKSIVEELRLDQQVFGGSGAAQMRGSVHPEWAYSLDRGAVKSVLHTAAPAHRQTPKATLKSGSLAFTIGYDLAGPAFQETDSSKSHDGAYHQQCAGFGSLSAFALERQAVDGVRDGP